MDLDINVQHLEGIENEGASSRTPTLAILIEEVECSKETYLSCWEAYRTW